MDDQILLELIINFVFGAVCFYCGYKYHEFRMVQEMVDLVHRMADKLSAREKATTTEDGEEIIHKKIEEMRHLRHELHNGVHYFYYEDDDGFACQGATLEEAAQRFKEATKGEVMAFFKLSDKDEAYAFIDGEVHDAEIKKMVL